MEAAIVSNPLLQPLLSSQPWKLDLQLESNSRGGRMDLKRRAAPPAGRSPCRQTRSGGGACPPPAQTASPSALCTSAAGAAAGCGQPPAPAPAQAARRRRRRRQHGRGRRARARARRGAARARPTCTSGSTKRLLAASHDVQGIEHAWEAQVQAQAPHSHLTRLTTGF